MINLVMVLHIIVLPFMVVIPGERLRNLISPQISKPLCDEHNPAH